MKRVHHRYRVGEFVTGRGLEAGEPVHRDDLDPVPELGRLRLQPAREHLFQAAVDHVQQPRRPGSVADRGEVDDHGDVLVAAAGVSQACSSTPITRTPSKRAGSAISSSRPAARTALLTVCHDAPRLAATRAIDSRSITTHFNATARVPGQLRPRRRGRRGVLAPDVAAFGATVAAHPDLQIRAAPAATPTRRNQDPGRRDDHLQRRRGRHRHRCSRPSSSSA